MKTIKKYLKYISVSLGLIILISLFINILYFFDLLNNSIYKLLLVVLNSAAIAIGAYLLGKNSIQKV